MLVCASILSLHACAHRRNQERWDKDCRRERLLIWSLRCYVSGSQAAINRIAGVLLSAVPAASDRFHRPAQRDVLPLCEACFCSSRCYVHTLYSDILDAFVNRFALNGVNVSSVAPVWLTRQRSPVHMREDGSFIFFFPLVKRLSPLETTDHCRHWFMSSALLLQFFSCWFFMVKGEGIRFLSRNTSPSKLLN